MCLTFQQWSCLLRTSIDCSWEFQKEHISKSFHPYLPCFTESLRIKRRSFCFLDLYLKKAKHLTYILKWKCRWNLKFFSSLCIPSGHNIVCGFNIKLAWEANSDSKLCLYMYLHKRICSAWENGPTVLKFYLNFLLLKLSFSIIENR